MRLLTLTALVLLAPALLAEPSEPKKEPAVREIKVDDLRFPERPGVFRPPTKIANATDLTAAIPDKNVQARILKEVDLNKEYLLLFAWSGSGGDRLSYALEKAKEGPGVIFTRTRGLTRDLRTHVKLYAVPKTFAWRMGG
jgi:hypothetical protein